MNISAKFIILFLLGTTAKGVEIPKVVRFWFWKKNSNIRSTCLATPIYRQNGEQNKCFYRFLTAAHCGVDNISFVSSDIALGKARWHKRAMTRSKNADIAFLNLKLPCGSIADKDLSIASKTPLSKGRSRIIRGAHNHLSGYVQYSSISEFNKLILKTTLPPKPGDSGAPIVNESGEIIGVLSGASIKKNETTFAYFSKNALPWVQANISRKLKNLK
jgi:hypothetical protein